MQKEQRRGSLLTGPLRYDDPVAVGGAEYTIVHADLKAQRRPTLAKEVGMGGMGVVYRARYKGFVDRAIKVLDPKPDLVGKIDPVLFEREFRREVRFLATLTHQHVAKLMDFGMVRTVDGTQRPFYTMDFIDGRPFDQFCKDDATTWDDFLLVVKQLLLAVTYLHAKGIMHGDLQHSNVLVRRPDESTDHRPEAVIVDLGIAKRIHPDPAKPQIPELTARDDDGDSTYFFGAKRFTPQDLQGYLGGRIPWDVLTKHFPRLDLYAIGILLQDAVANKGLSRKLADGLGAHGYQALLGLLRQLLAAGPDAGGYTTAAEVLGDWRKLHPTYLFPLGVPELALATGSDVSISTNRGRISLTERIDRCISHPLFQRLHLIPQLELAQLVYPGAVHSRFTHSLNSFKVSREYVANLLTDPRFRLLAERPAAEATIFKALLHDIGHYPFSHMFEDFVAAERLGDEPGTVASDDDLFSIFAGTWDFDHRFEPGFVEEIRRIAARGRGDWPRADATFEQVIERMLDKEAIGKLAELSAPSTPETKVFAGVLSSPCDADKVSYLQDDSIMTGVRFGQSIEVDGLLRSLICPGDRELATPARHGVLALRVKGLPSAESVLMARYWMLKTVYWHHTNRAIMAMFKFVIAQLLSNGRLDFPRYLDATLFSDAREAARWLSNVFGQLCRVRSAPEGFVGWCNPLEGLLDGRRAPYKRFVTITYSHGQGESDPDVYRALENIQPMKDHVLLREVAGIVSRFTGLRGVKAGEILLDVPFKRRDQTGGVAYVYTDDGTELIGEVLAVSPMLSQLRNEFGLHAKKCRLVIHPALDEALGERLGAAKAEVRAWLRARYTTAG